MFELQATTDLEEVDKKRRDEFKNYEMEKEHLRRQQMEQLDEEKRLKVQKEFEEMQQKHKEHPKVNHPVSWGNLGSLVERLVRWVNLGFLVERLVSWVDQGSLVKYWSVESIRVPWSNIGQFSQSGFLGQTFGQFSLSFDQFWSIVWSIQTNL